MYCLKCKKNTETINERKKEIEEWVILIGKCKVCNVDKREKLYKIKKCCSAELLI